MEGINIFIVWCYGNINGIHLDYTSYVNMYVLQLLHYRCCLRGILTLRIQIEIKNQKPPFVSYNMYCACSIQSPILRDSQSVPAIMDFAESWEPCHLVYSCTSPPSYCTIYLYRVSDIRLMKLREHCSAYSFLGLQQALPASSQTGPSYCLFFETLYLILPIFYF